MILEQINLGLTLLRSSVRRGSWPIVFEQIDIGVTLPRIGPFRAFVGATTLFRRRSWPVILEQIHVGVALLNVLQFFCMSFDT